MILFQEIIANFEKTFKLADIPSTRLNVVVVLFGDKGTQVFQRLPKNQPWFEEYIARVSSSSKLSLQRTDNNINQIAYDSLDKDEIFVMHSGSIKEYKFQIMVLLPIEQTDFRLFATAICSLLAEATSDHWILSINFSADNLCRTASRLVMQQVMGVEPHSAESLSILLDRIAFLPYEDRKSYGSIIFLKRLDTHTLEDIYLKKHISFSNVRGIRKLLEIGKDKFCLMATEEGIYGLRLKQENSNNSVQVDFRSDSSWVLTQNGQKIYQVRAGLPMVFRPKLEAKFFYQELQTAFPRLSIEQTQDLLVLLSHAISQPHGTNILIIDNALKITQRLESQCTQIEPIRLTNDMMAHISRIDGTVIIEPEGICVGFGAILDGQASRQGDSARGGRYNSAVMFCENSEVPCLIIVVSQDGTVDIVSSVKNINS